MLPTVLLIDDEPQILSSLQLLLVPHAYQVLTASCGANAIDILNNHRVDVVISDERMPDMVGGDLLKKISQSWPEIVRILLTGYASLDVALRAINDACVFRLLEKPCPPNIFLQTLKEAIEHKKNHQQMHEQAHEQSALLAHLTKRERELVQLLLSGQRLPTIAKAWRRSVHTVRNHLKTIFKKLNVHSQPELIDLINHA